MAEEDDSQKTEDPTDKKKSKAKEKGQTAQSQEVKHWVILFTASIGLIFMAPGMATDIRVLGSAFILRPHEIAPDFENLRFVFSEIWLELGIIMAPMWILLIVLVIASNLAQSGFVWAPSKLEPKASNMSVIKGAKRMFSVKSLIEFAKGIMKLSLVAIVAYIISIPFADDIINFALLDVSFAIDRVLEISIWFFLASMGVMTTIAGLDFAYQKHTHHKQLKMSKHEVKEEVKQSEGDPQIKARIRQIRTERAQQRMMAAVPEANVVITNPTHYAVALKYKMDDMQAPLLVAKGVDSLAFRIRETAEEHDIPIVENPPLARALYAAVELDEEIPSEHYMAVAEVIGYVMRMRGELPPVTPDMVQ